MRLMAAGSIAVWQTPQDQEQLILTEALLTSPPEAGMWRSRSQMFLLWME